jgi:ornithine--oxo-acid transaminase
MNTSDYIALEEEFGAHNYHPLDVVITKAEGCWVHDVEGNKYLDCLAAYSAVNQGHCHPKILEAFIEQAKKVTLTSRAFRNDQLPLLYKELHELTGFDMSLPMNSGAEAVETAVKAARRWGYRVKGIPEDQAEIICATNNFHGRTVTIISFSTDEQYRADFGPMTPGFPIVEYGNIEDLKMKISSNTAAIMLEPIQGEAGIVVPPDGYLKEVEQICREHNILLVMDEIQSGLGRSGKLFAYQHEDIQPDMVIIGKALSGGFMPISAVLARKDVLGVFGPGDHGSTFGGSPLAAAVARAALKVIQDEYLVTRSAELGAYFINKLRGIVSRNVVEVRGRGLWIGFVLSTKARPYCERLMREGILCKETHENVIRFAPPLVITKEEIDWAVDRVAKVVMELDAEYTSEPIL